MTASGVGAEPTLLLSVDFEDWHQLVRRRFGTPGWEEPGPALPRQTAALLELFDELDVRATFFVLGMAARAHPGLVRDVAAAGHEIACHGDAHEPVGSQSREAFAADVRAARATIEDLTAERPRGYRAPAFSITRRSPWAHEVLAAEGFAYDASHSDSPIVRDRRRVSAAERTPHPLATDPELWEFPVAAWHAGPVCLPVGGASYWSLTPTPVVLHGLARAGADGGLYLHPHELDPEPLRPGLSPAPEPVTRARAGLRTVQRNLARRRAPDVLRAIAERFSLTTYGEAHARLSHHSAPGS